MIHVRHIIVALLSSALMTGCATLDNIFTSKKSAPTASAAPVSPPIDYAAISSRDQLLALYERGVLTKVFLRPSDLGGKDDSTNVVYIPIEAAALKIKLDEEIMTAALKGDVSRYRAQPVYAPRSFIPKEIVVEVTGRLTIRRVITVW